MERCETSTSNEGRTMTNKSQKQHSNRRRAQKRRARRVQKKRRRRAAQSVGRPGAPRHYVTAIRSDGTSTIQEVSRAELALHGAYVEAHRLLPAGYPSSHADVRATAPQALRILTDPLSSNESVLQAIMILGHTPTTEALAALRRHASARRPHADMARLAADECESLWGAGQAAPNREQPPDLTLN